VVVVEHDLPLPQVIIAHMVGIKEVQVVLVAVVLGVNTHMVAALLKTMALGVTGALLLHYQAKEIQEAIQIPQQPIFIHMVRAAEAEVRVKLEKTVD
tara:strand:+ start:87 stop:377 length:291 start_codon:yes stop_codon:yes gene_type:complete